jgi:hypothetical protein
MDIQFNGQTIRVPDGATDAQIQAILTEVMRQDAAAPATPAAAAPRRPTSGMTGGPAVPTVGSVPVPTVEVMQPGTLLSGFTGIGIGVQPGSERAVDPSATSAPPPDGGAAPYVPGGSSEPGSWNDALAHLPGIGGAVGALVGSTGMSPRDALRMLGQGALLGGADETLAGARWLSGDDYGTALAQERQADKAIEEAFPTASTVAQVAGGVGAGVLTGAGLAGMGVAMPASTIGRTIVGAGTGAVAGGVDAFNRGEGDFHHRIEQVIPGAITGGVFGAAFPLLGRLGGLAWNKLSGPAANAYEDALRIINSRLKADTVTPEAAGRRLGELGPDAMLVDAGGPNIRRLGGSAYRAPGEGSTIAYDALADRASGQSGRVYDAFTRAYAPDGVPDYFEAVDSLMAQRSREAAPLYDKAFATGTGVVDTRIETMMADPIMRQGLKQGLEIQRIEALAEGKPFNPSEYGVTGFNEAGDPIIGTVPNFRTLDAAKRGLDDILEQWRDPLTGKLNLNSYGRAVERLRSSFVAELDRVNPDYAAARAAWAGPSQALDAMALGARIVNEDNRSIARMLDGMSPTEREFVQVGVVDAIRKTLRSAPDGADAVKRIFGSSWKRDALAALFDDPAQFAMFKQQMEAESQFFRTQTSIMGNSMTAERGAADAANGLPTFGQSIGGNLALDLATGQPPGTIGMARMFLDTLFSDAPRATPAAYEEIARMLFSRTPADNARALEALRTAGIYDRRARGGLLGAQTGAAGLLGSEIATTPGRVQGLLSVP